MNDATTILPHIRTAPAATHPCVLHKFHKPAPLITQGHHVFPLEMQKTVWPDTDRDVPGSIHDPELIWVCGTGHDTLHAIIRGMPTTHRYSSERRWAKEALHRLRVARVEALRT